MTELQSLKNPTRLLTILMFVAFTIYTLGVEGIAQILPMIPDSTLTVIVGIATLIVTQYGTEKRIVRAEELKEEEFQLEGLDDGV